MMVALPMTNNRIVVHKFDVDEAMEKAGIDHLYVSSRPVTQIEPGRNYRYQIGVKSKKGGVAFKLDSGPEGMSWPPDGKLTWKVPADFADGEQNIIITVSDKTGQELFHTFKVSVARPVAFEQSARRSAQSRGCSAEPQ